VGVLVSMAAGVSGRAKGGGQEDSGSGELHCEDNVVAYFSR
jgi:hypothetical protein